MKAHNILLFMLFGCSYSLVCQVNLYSEEFTDEVGAIAPQTVYTPGTADRVSWGVSGTPGPNQSSGQLRWVSATETCSWVSETVFVAGYTSLELDVTMTESGDFTGSDSINVIIIEDGVHRLVSSQVGNDFGSLSITNEPCTASVSLQVLIHVMTTGFLDAVYLDEVTITGIAAYTDIDMDGINDASDVCIDMDDDGTCDGVDASIMLMDEDFSSYAIGTGVGRRADDEAGIAHVEGVTGAGMPGWALLGEEQTNSVAVRSSGGNTYLKYQRTGASTVDTTTVTMMTRCFDLSHITDPKVRIQASEVTDFAGDDTNGGLVCKLIEDGVERQVMHLTGEFTSVDSTIGTTAVNKLTIVIEGYAQWESIVQLDGISVFGSYCQTGKDGSGNCQDLGCTDSRACTYSAIAITHDPTKCKYLGDSCDDADATTFKDRYKNAGDGTCACEGYALQTLYLENFAANGAAAGGLNYGYDGSLDIDGNGTQNEDNAASETEWSLSFEDATYATGSPLVPSPLYFATKVESSDTIMRAYNTLGNYIRWTTKSVDVSSFDSVYVSGELLGLGNQATSDYAHFGWEDGTTLQSPLLAEITGVSSSTESVNQKVTSSSGTIRLRVEVENNTSGSNNIAAHGFDDIAVRGLKKGCVDPDASNYDASPADGFVAKSDDGSCQYDWATVYSRKDGEFSGEIWAGKPCSEAGYSCGASSLYIDIHTVTENGTRHAVVSSNTAVTVPAGGYTLGELTLESGAELVIPDGLTLTVDGAVHHKGGTISGTGRLIVKGEMEIAAGVTSVDVHDFTFGAGGQLNLSNGDTLRVKGDLTIDDGNAIAGRIELSGTSAQTVSGLDVHFDTLRIENLAGVTFSAGAVIEGVLDIDQGVVEMDGNTMTFSSDANGTGMLDMIASGASLEDNSSGGLEAANAIVKRYVAPDGDGTTYWGYTLFGSPLVGATVGDFDFASDFYFAGIPGSDYPDATSTVMFWDEKNSNIVQSHSANTPLDTLGGCWVTLIGSQTPTLYSEGKLRSHVSGGSVSLNLTRTPSSSYDGWNLMFNPFQAMLDWNEIADHGSNSTLMEDQYAVWDTQGKEFLRYSETNGLFTSASRYIHPGQGFWVRMNHATDTTGSIVIPTSAINTVGDGGDFIRSEAEGFDAQLVLEVENYFGSNQVMVQIGDAGSTEYVREFDLSYMPSASGNKAQMAILAGEWPCISKALPRESQSELWIKSFPNWETTLRVVGFTANADVCVTVTDTETGDVLVGRIGDELTFTMPANESENGRFILEVVPSAQFAARPPSCPEMQDGRVEVNVGEEPANVLLTDGGDNVLDQIIGATGAAAFEGLSPGEYGLVVAGPGMKCGTEHRSFTVMPGEQPELLGLDWEVPSCNEGDVSLDFELYGHGDFNTTLRLGNEAVWSNMEQGGEVNLEGLAPGTYALEVDHVCLEETIVLDLYDSEAVIAEADYDAMVILDPVGGTALEALSTCIGEENYRWLVDGEVIGENAPLFHTVEAAGGHVVELEAWNSTCFDIIELPFLVINWNESRVLDAPVTVREDAAQWTFVFGRDLGWTQLRMTDAAGRVVWTEQVQAEEGYVHRVNRPATAGTYLMQVIGDGGQWGLPLLNAGF